MANGIELSLSYFGKKITMKNESPVLHAGELYKMFRSIMIAEFGEDTWDNLTKVQDKINPIIEWEQVLDDIFKDKIWLEN